METRARAQGTDEELELGRAKVPSDPARLSTSTASFRLRLAVPVRPLIAVPEGVFAGRAWQPPRPVPVKGKARRLVVEAQPILLPTMVQPSRGEALVGAGVVGDQARREGRVTPITWVGSPDSGLVDAVRSGGVPEQAGPEDVDTRSLPRLSGVGYDPQPEQELTTVQPVRSFVPEGAEEFEALYGREPGEPVRHAWYPGKRVDLGLVLLPLRVFLGGISVYAGFSKLCDPVYFDGGRRGSMMHWLESLHPWALAGPLVGWAEQHPVGAGLAVAFTQVVVGVLAVLGLWARLAAGLGMLLSLALLLTVSWRSVPVYDAPQIVYLAAWSPLLIAGAPFFSLDGRLALDAWRKLGHRAEPAQLRRRVLRRGAVLAALVGGAALVTGSLLGAAVRSSQVRDTVDPQRPSVPTQYPSPVWPSTSATPKRLEHRPVRRPSAKPSRTGASVLPSPGLGAGRHHGLTGSGRGSTGSSSSATGNSPTAGGTGSGSGSGSGSTPSGGTLGGLLG